MASLAVKHGSTIIQTRKEVYVGDTTIEINDAGKRVKVPFIRDRYANNDTVCGIKTKRYGEILHGAKHDGSLAYPTIEEPGAGGM